MVDAKYCFIWASIRAAGNMTLYSQPSQIWESIASGDVLSNLVEKIDAEVLP